MYSQPKIFQLGAPFLIAIACHAEAAEIQVRLLKYAHLSQSAVREAKETASWALREAGIRLLWVECAAGAGGPIEPGCRLPITPLDLQIRLIDEGMAKRLGRRAICMGLAIVTDESASLAVVYAHRGRELGANNLATQGQILGGIMAHEIGHLLRVPHAAQGLMRPVWDDQSLKDLAKGRLRFSEAQAQCAVRAVSKRAAASLDMHQPASAF